MLKSMKQHSAAGLATVLLYKILGGADTKWVAAVVCMYMWMLVTEFAIDVWMQDRKKKKP